MHATEIQDVARRLREAHGDRATVVAAQKAVVYERAGDHARGADVAPHRGRPPLDARPTPELIGRTANGQIADGRDIRHTPFADLRPPGTALLRAGRDPVGGVGLR